MIKLVAFDLDGTLFDSEKIISDNTIKYLSELAKRGIEVVPATGRPYGGLMDQVEKIKGINYVITSNGANIFKKSNDESIYRALIPKEIGCEVLERLLKLDVMCDPFIGGQSYMSSKKVPMIEKMRESKGIKQYLYSTRKVVDDLYACVKNLDEDFEKITINFIPDEIKNEKGSKNCKPGGGQSSSKDCEQDSEQIPAGEMYPRKDLDKVMEIMSEYSMLNSISGGMRNIEVTAAGVDKGTALQWLCGELNISMSETMTFGDSGNDILMLKKAGLGVAMANAEDEAKDAADFITLSNDEEGVLYALKKYVPLS